MTKDDPPGRPSAAPRNRRRRDARPGEILAAARAEFARHGFAATRLTDVAARAGISHGTIYNYYRDKEDLFRAVFRASLVDPLGLPGPEPDALPGRAADRLRAGLRHAFHQLAGSDLLPLLRILLVEADRFPDLARTCWSELSGRAEALLGAEIDRGIADGSLRPGSWQDHPLPLLAPGILAALLGPLSGDDDWLARADRQIEAGLDALFGGIAAPRP